MPFPGRPSPDTGCVAKPKPMLNPNREEWEQGQEQEQE
jgi:hypothetical protein